ERGGELARLARRYGFLILEDVAYRDLGFSSAPPPSLWSLAPDVVLQAGTFSKIFFPGVRLGWAAGPAEIVSQLVVAKQNSDQCSGALGQRMLEAYWRAGHLDRQIVSSGVLLRAPDRADNRRAQRANAGRHHRDAATGRVLCLADRAGRGGHGGPVGGRPGPQGGLRARPAVLPRRRRRRADPACLQPGRR